MSRNLMKVDGVYEPFVIMSRYATRENVPIKHKTCPECGYTVNEAIPYFGEATPTTEPTTEPSADHTADPVTEPATTPTTEPSQGEKDGNGIFLWIILALLLIAVIVAAILILNKKKKKNENGGKNGDNKE